MFFAISLFQDSNAKIKMGFVIFSVSDFTKSLL